MPSLSSSTLLLSFAILLLLAHPTHAFGAGNIASVSKIEGLNWRHGDIEDTLLSLVMSRACGGKKFDKMMVARVYFGNWLRDYSQAIDVGTVKHVSAEAIRILLWVLGFMTFGFGTREFEVTAQRLGCYRPEDHIDNPKDYADNLDASQYDRRLRGPVDEKVELAIDPETGMKNYIANERVGITTSAQHVRQLFRECIRLGRSYGRSNNKDELYEALRLLGTGLHCLEDFSAHSNYTELALIEMGERDVFPHVGRSTRIDLPGAQHPVYPLITGTFGGVDFLHSVMGEFDDKATQSEIQALEGTMQEGSRANTSVLKDLLNSVPSGLFGGKDEAGKADELQANASAAQASQGRVSPKDPEAFTRQMQQVAKEIYPIIQWHDEVMQQIREAIEKIPILPDLIENIQEQINIFVFSLLAPFVLPIISQIKAELNTGSSEVIQSSKDKQLIVFHDDHSTDPTHSMLSKDHFSNILNEAAGRIASEVLKWVVPQLISCWDDERVDPERTINRIINGVFHHPALRNQGDDGASDGRQIMFRVVEEWWRNKGRSEQDEYRRKLSREGVEKGDNHLEGVHDTGHGCGAPLKMSKQNLGASSNTLANPLMGGHGGSSGFSEQASSGIGKLAGEAVGGGALGGIVGALAGGVGGSLLAGVLGNKGKAEAYSSQGYNSQGNYEQRYTEMGHAGNRYAQAEVTQEQFPDGGRRTEYQQYHQSGGRGEGFEEISEQRPSHGGGYEQTNERIYERSDGRVETETWREGQTADGRHYHEARHHKEERSGSDDEDGERRKKHGKHHRHRKSDSSNGDDDRAQGYVPEREERRERYEEPSRQGYGGGHGRQREESGEREGYEEPLRQEYGGGYGRQRDEEPLRQEYGGGYGRQRDEEASRQEYGGGYGGERERRGEAERGPGGYGGGEFGETIGGLAERFDGLGFDGGNHGNEGGWGQRERDEEPEDERREERGWGF
ncbi:hypothetical protein DSL72_004003 [Monilinia vaccinii-corymbosi]|uniref:Het-C-domain-containing protein n=1 Tax=Monilinia vaccinii-corymbosi TaxID=61207 RepID=A0A8A3P8F2_9HELO|nr:hypothetical protein DSL72_004003 [Monilinia vaccinii-corymbosi]